MSLRNKGYKRAELAPAEMKPPTADTRKQCHSKKSRFCKPFDFEVCVREAIQAHEALKYKHE